MQKLAHLTIVLLRQELVLKFQLNKIKSLIAQYQVNRVMLKSVAASRNLSQSAVILMACQMLFAQLEEGYICMSSRQQGQIY